MGSPQGFAPTLLSYWQSAARGRLAFDRVDPCLTIASDVVASMDQRLQAEQESQAQKWAHLAVLGYPAAGFGLAFRADG